MNLIDIYDQKRNKLLIIFFLACAHLHVLAVDYFSGHMQVAGKVGKRPPSPQDEVKVYQVYCRHFDFFELFKDAEIILQMTSLGNNERAKGRAKYLFIRAMLLQGAVR